MDKCKDIQFSGLRKLCLGKLHVDDHTMQNLLQSCPLIEDLRLVSCRGLRSLFTSSSKLIRVDLHNCDRLNKVELQAPSLEMFWFHEDTNKPCEFHLEMCTPLKSLALKVAKLKDDSFQNLLSCFPVVEHLTLSKCCALEQVTISSHRLKTLVLRGCKRLKEADIDTPNLLSLEFKGSAEIPFSTFNPVGLKEAKLSFNCHRPPRRSLPSCRIDDAWSAKLQKYIEKFDKNLRMIVRSAKNVILHEDLREILIPQSEALNLEFVKSSASLEDVVDRLLQTWYPKQLTTISSTSSNFSERVFMRMVDREVKPRCCTYNVSNKKCWRHYLKDVRLEDCDDESDRDECDWRSWLSSSASTMMNEIICYGLEWSKKEINLEEDEM